MATHSNSLAWEIPRTRGACWLQTKGLQSQTWLSKWAWAQLLLTVQLDDTRNKNVSRHIPSEGGDRNFWYCSLLEMGSDGKRICLYFRRPGFDPWVRKIPWRREWLPSPVFLPGESHGQRNLGDYCPWDHKRVIYTSATNTHTHNLFRSLLQGYAPMPQLLRMW